MRVLGAVLAGGRSRRFGSDKAEALLGDRSLIAHVLGRVAVQTDGLVVCGRRMADASFLPDRPETGLGPLGGLAGALHMARNDGYDAVLSVPCDVPAVPDDLRARLEAAGEGGAASYVVECPVIGLWPASATDVIDRHLAEGQRSMRSWAARIAARGCTLGAPLVNINTPDDLARAEAGRA